MTAAEMVEPEPRLRRMSYDSLEGEEVDHFLAALGTDPHGADIDGVLEMIDQGRFQLWVWGDGDCSSILITEIVCQLDGEKELFLRMFAGREVVNRWADGSADLAEVAKAMGCVRLSAYIKSELIDIFESAADDSGNPVGWKRSYIVVTKEIEE